MGISQSAAAYHEKASNLRKLGQTEAALALYDKAIELEPNTIQNYILKSYALIELGRVEDALSTIEKAVKINPNDCPSQNTKGWILMDLGDYERAIEAYDKIIKLNPYNCDAHTNKSLLLYLSGKREEAIKYFDTHHRAIGSNGWLCYAMKGKALYELERPTEGLESYQKAMEIINQGKLNGNEFTSANGETVFLNLTAMQLVTSIKEIVSMEGLLFNEAQSAELEAEVQKFNEKKDALKIKFINTALLNVEEKRAKQQRSNDPLKEELDELKKMYARITGQVAGIKEPADAKEDLQAPEEGKKETDIANTRTGCCAMF